MKNFFVLILYLAGFVAPIHSFLENVPAHPWLFGTQMKRLQPKRLTGFPRPLRRQDIPKFMYWKHLLELECIKEICGYVHLKDRSNYQNPFEIIRHKQLPAFTKDGTGTGSGHQVQGFYKMRENQLHPGAQPRRKHPGYERVILWPPERVSVPPNRQGFPNPGREEPQRKKPQGKTNESALAKGYVDVKNEHRFPGKFQNPPAEVLESFSVFQDEDGLRRMGPVGDAFSRLFKKPGLMQSSTAGYSDAEQQGFRHSDRIQPYEVEEIIEEKFQVDVNDEKDEDDFEDLAGEEDEKGKTSEGKVNEKGENFESVIDDSVNTILKGLINPEVKTSPDKDVSKDRFPLEKLQKRPSWSNYRANSSTTSFIFRTYTSFPPPERTNGDPFGVPWNRQDTYTRLKKVHPTPPPMERYHGWRQKTAEATQKSERKPLRPDNPRLDSSRGFDFIPSVKKDTLNGFLTTDSPKRFPPTEAHPPPFLHVFQTEGIPRSEAVPKNTFDLTPADTMKSLDLLKDLIGGHQSDLPSDVITSPVTQRTANGSGNPVTWIPKIAPEESTTVSWFERPEWVFAEEDAPLTTQGFVETVKYFSRTDTNAGGITERNFPESTDQPESFDLLGTTPEPNKDQEAVWKNSRKMHFGRGFPETTATNGISGLNAGSAEQRRSDILITEDFADYVDDENNLSTLNYLDKLKQNHSLHSPQSPDPLNFTTDTLIPLVPVVINDLREGKIPPEDHSILSQALGKYWKPILALSNLTNLDMLPLLKMKDEKDLETVVRNFLPEDITTAGTTGKDYGDDDYGQSYDYMDEYKELYKDILGQELGDKRRRFRPRRDAEDDMKTLEATREYFESIEEEQSDDGSDYIFEDIIYDEVTDGEESSVFELMEVADVVVDKET